MTRAAKIPPPPPSLSLSPAALHKVCAGREGSSANDRIRLKRDSHSLHFPFRFPLESTLKSVQESSLHLYDSGENLFSDGPETITFLWITARERDRQSQVSNFFGMKCHGQVSPHSCIIHSVVHSIGRNFISLLAVKTLVVHFRVFSSGHFIVGRETRRFVPLANGTMHLRRLWQLRSVTLKRFLQNA